MPGNSSDREHDVDDFFNASGAGTNRTRPASYPVLDKSKQLDVTARAAQPNINLYNFEDPHFDNTKYVLTSPRSLEACSRLGIKPVEMLYKPLIEFQEELVPRGIPMKTIYSVYEEHERERINKLEMCREEYTQITDEDSLRGENYISPVIVTSPKFGKKMTMTSGKRTTLKKDSSPESQEDDDLSEFELDEDGSKVKSDQDGKTKGKPIGEVQVDIGTLQRKRTAWTTSIGHNRVTQEELDKRANYLHEKGRKPLTKVTKKKKKVTTARPSSGKKVTIRNGAKKPADTEKKQAGRKHRYGRGSGGGHTGSGDGSDGGDSKTPSLTDLSMASTRNSRTPWAKDPTADAKPIVDPALRNKLRSAKGTKVTPRDQKILELMLSKREEERKRAAEREAVKLQWEEEKRLEQQRKAEAEKQKRRTLVTDDKKVKDHHHSQHSLNCPRKHGNHDFLGRDDTVKCCDRNWAISIQKLQEEKERKVQEKKLQNMQRKKSQEQRLEQQRKEQEELKREALEKQRRELRRAQSLRETRENQVALQRKMKNYYHKKKHEEKVDQLKKQSEEEKEQLQVAIDMKLTAAQGHASEVRERKDKELRKSLHGSYSTDLDHRIQRSRDSQQKMQEELDAYHKDLVEYRKIMAKKAEDQAQQELLKKKKRAQDDRLQKERLQKQNMQKLLDQEEEWRTGVEATIAMKDARSRMLQMEKDEAVQESRAMAMASQRLREELRSAYSTDHIDQLSKRAAMESRLERSLGNTPKNLSTLTLG